MTDYYVDEDYDDLDDYDDDFDYDEDDVDDEPSRRPRLRSSGEIESPTSWSYLGLLAALFVGLVFFSWACDRSPAAVDGEPTSAAPDVTGSPVRLSILIEGDAVVLDGTVPDAAARDQLVAATEAEYGAENVIQQLEINPDVVLEGGSVSIRGVALFDDDRPARLQQSVISGFGLTDAGFDVTRGEGALPAVDLAAELIDGRIRFSGKVPDDISVTELQEAAETVWGPGSADVSGLTVDSSTWTDGRIRVSGGAPPGDDRATGFEAQVQRRFGVTATVDLTGLEVDFSPEVLARFEEEIGAFLAAQPILFAPQSAEIDTASDQVLVEIAGVLQGIPGVNVEVVGHTDSQGVPEENLILSQERAETVRERLVELGIDGARINARGEGANIPLVPNDTPENQALNRRIEFSLIPPG